MLECLAVQKLEDEIVDALVVTDIVKGADVRVVELRDRAGLALEALAQPGITVKQVWQDFDCDGPIQPGVAGAIHGSHTA